MNQWISVINGKIPDELLGIKGGQWEYRLQHGEIYIASGRPDEYQFDNSLRQAGDIVAVRLLPQEREIWNESGWFWVYDGLCHANVLLDGELLECKFDDGRFAILPYDGGFQCDIVAARRVKTNTTEPKAERDIQAEAGWFWICNGMCNEKHLFHGQMLEYKFEDGTFMTLPNIGEFPKGSVAARRVKPPTGHASAGREIKPSPEQDKLINLGILDPRIKQPIAAMIPNVFTKTINGRDIQDIEAYERFRRSPRGRDALSMIGKHEWPEFKPLGQCEIERLIMESLEESFK